MAVKSSGGGNSVQKHEKRRKPGEFGRKVFLALEHCGLSNTELERRAKLPKGRISVWTRGTPGGKPERVPPAELLRLANAVGLPVYFFCDPKLKHPADAAHYTEPDTASEDEVLIRNLVKVIGVAEAKRRLMVASEAGGGRGDVIRYRSNSPELHSEESPKTRGAKRKPPSED